MAKDLIYLRKPARNDRRRSYRLMHNNKTVESPELNSVNGALLSGELSRERADAMACEVLAAYRKKHAPIVAAYLPENEEIARRFIAEVLALKTNRAPRAAEDRILRVAKSVGRLSLRSAPLLDLRRALDRWDGRPYNDRVGALNQLMAYVGRPDRLPRKVEAQPNPKHLLLGEFEKAISYIDDLNIRTLCWAAFGTGARFGELFAITRIDNGQVYIPGQIKGDSDRQAQRDETGDSEKQKDGLVRRDSGVRALGEALDRAGSGDQEQAAPPYQAFGYRQGLLSEGISGAAGEVVYEREHAI